jgi:uncharacterized protein
MTTVTTQTPAFDPVPTLAQELSLPPAGVLAVVRLLSEGATVPFIARYRKEATGGLDEVQIRAIEERRTYLVELEQRRAAVLDSIREQGQLSPALEAKLKAATTKQALEDLYLPFKPKRRSKATIAREHGLGPLADRILAQPREGSPLNEAAAFIKPELEIPDVEAALAGAREIVIETIAERPEVRAIAREHYAKQGVLETRALPSVDASAPSKFADYFEWSEAAADIPSHRYLAIRRGETEGVLRSSIRVDTALLQPSVEALMQLDPSSPFAAELRGAIDKAVRGRLGVGVEMDVRVDLKQRSDREAVEVFADNLGNLLLAAPLGAVPIIGIDPGLRTGCKCAAIDATGKYLETTTIYPVKDEDRAMRELAAFVSKHRPRALAIGNGTGGRETEALARRVVASLSSCLAPAQSPGPSQQGGAEDLRPMVVSVSEAGASVYSASEVAREEFPELDLTIRGAISIARRLQDPLAELVKIDPKSIGVGQYQHDVQQTLLRRKLHEVVESCVNRVGVELNTASAPLLAYVAGIGESLAKEIVAHRERSGAFASRAALRSVRGLGPKTFEQAAGFLRVRESPEPLDRSAVHPERYSLVERIAADLGVDCARLVGDSNLAARIDIRRYVDTEVGEPTLRDIVGELAKPGRDPRAKFEAAQFRDDVHTVEDLQVGMALEGVVTNVTNFGAFVDVGVHQDGLVHVSELSDKWVDDPRKVVKVGDKLRVRVLSVDLQRQRIALTAKQQAKPMEQPQQQGKPKQQQQQGKPKQQGKPDRDTQGFANNPFAKLR